MRMDSEQLRLRRFRATSGDMPGLNTTLNFDIASRKRHVSIDRFVFHKDGGLAPEESDAFPSFVPGAVTPGEYGEDKFVREPTSCSWPMTSVTGSRSQSPLGNAMKTETDSSISTTSYCSAGSLTNPAWPRRPYRSQQVSASHSWDCRFCRACEDPDRTVTAASFVGAIRGHPSDR